MKQITRILSFAAILSLCACGEKVYEIPEMQEEEKETAVDPDKQENPALQEGGRWPSVEMDNSLLAFSAAGGEKTVTALNYDCWWIVGGYGGEEKEDYVLPSSSGGENANTFDLLDGGWYHALVPNEGASNQLIVTVDENLVGVARQACIEMQVGDVFAQVTITQE